MKVRSRLFLVASLALAGCEAPDGSGRVGTGASRRPNIVFIFSDDHATAAIGCYGSRINSTPHIDRLAAEGVVFENAFCTNSICAPSRAVILTGKHSHLNGVPDNVASFDGNQATFPRLLRAAGYQTALIGKWHLKSDPTGFDYWDILPGQGEYYSPDFKTAEGRRREKGYVTDVITDLTLRWLREERDPSRPFLLMSQHKAPHRSWMPGPDHLAGIDGGEVPEPATLFDDYRGRSDAARDQAMEIGRHMYPEYDLKLAREPADAPAEGPDRWAPSLVERMSPDEQAAWNAAFASGNQAFRAADLEGRELVRWKYQRYIKSYLGCVASIDDNIGRLLECLDDEGLTGNTIVVYSSDQGFFLGEHGWYDKRFMYEPSLRMPLVVRWPAVVEAGTRRAELVQNLDFAQTLLDVAGVPAAPEMQGASLLPLLRGNVPEDWRESVYYEYFERAVHSVALHRGVRTQRYKLIHFHELGQWELYDLERDPEEVDNLYGQPRLESVQRELEEELARLMKACGRT